MIAFGAIGRMDIAGMTSRIAALLVGGLLSAASLPCFADDVDDFADAALTREQWQQRVEAARRRTQDFLANPRQPTDAPSPHDQREAEAADRIVKDPTLRQGDIVSTGRGLFVFVGRDEEHRSSDFLPMPAQPLQSGPRLLKPAGSGPP